MNQQHDRSTSQQTIPQLLLYALATTIRNPLLFLAAGWAFAGVSWLVFTLQGFLNDLLIQMIRDGHIPERFQSSLALAHSMIPWIITLPLIISICTFGAPVLFLNDHKAPLVASIKALFVSIKYSVMGVTYSLKVLPYFLVPAIAVMLLDPIVSVYIHSNFALYGYYAVLIGIFTWTMHLCLPVLLVPFLCAVNQLQPMYVIDQAFRFHKQNSLRLFALLVLEIVSMIGIAYMCSSLSLDVVAQHVASYLCTYTIGFSIALMGLFHAAQEQAYHHQRLQQR